MQQYFIPLSLFFWPEVTHTSTGKVQFCVEYLCIALFSTSFMNLLLLLVWFGCNFYNLVTQFRLDVDYLPITSLQARITTENYSWDLHHSWYAITSETNANGTGLERQMPFYKIQIPGYLRTFVTATKYWFYIGIFLKLAEYCTDHGKMY